MSLLVWLPLTEDTENRGLSNLTFSTVSTNTSKQTGGKIGANTYKNNSNSDGGLISNTKLKNLGNNVSMFAWIKLDNFAVNPIGIGGTHTILGSGYPAATGMGFNVVSSGSSWVVSVNTGNGSTRTWGDYRGNTALVANTWYHVGFTYDGNHIRIYVNGNLDATHAYSGQSNPEDYVHVFSWARDGLLGTPTIFPHYKTIGGINDFRIYDHCLSPKEIKEISKGLAAHYRLCGHGRPNYLKGAGTHTEKNPLIRNVTDSSVYNDSYVYYDLSNLSVTIPADGTYTWILESDGVPSGHVTSGTNHTERRFSMWLQNTSSGNHYVWGNQGTAPNGEKYGSVSVPAGTYKIRSNLYAADNVNYTVKMWNIRLVAGSYAENDPWQPNSADPLYSQLNYGVSPVTLTNIVGNSSFESTSGWNGAVLDTSQKLFGSQSLKLVGTTVVTRSIANPIVGHKYYGREYIKSSGDISPTDCRFEYYGGDGVGLNWVFNYNNGNHPDWEIISGIITIDVVNGTAYNVRTFTVSAQNPAWIDGIMIIDLTASFGAGNEPSKEWCDKHIPYIEGTIVFSGYEEDYSGYGNRATKIGNIGISTNSPLHRNSYSFSGSQALACGRKLMLTDSFTVACWAYSSDWANFNGCFVSCTDSGGWGLGYQANTSGHGFEAYIGSKYYGIDMNYNGLSAGWHHIAATYNKSSITGYIDGVQVATLSGVPATGVVYNPANGIFIGMEAAGNETTPNGYPLNGQLSDMRIYGTALSAADVKELATRVVSVDNTGKNFCYNIQEKISNSSVGKEGFVAAKGITECKAPLYEGMKVKQLPDGSMWGRIHYLDITSDKTFFANAAEVGECIGKPNRYSRMDDLKHYKDPDGNYELMLTYPQLDKTLPAGYTQLEYIEFTGAQLLRTGVYGYSSGGNVRGHRWELDMQFERNGIRQLMGYGPNGYEYWGMADSGLYEGMGVFAGERDKIVHDYTNGTGGGNTLWVKNNQRDVAANLDTSQEYCLFGLNWNGGPGYFCYGKLYRCKCIQANNALIRDFVPAIRNSDGAVGLFDIVNNGFYASATATPFKAGNPTYSITPIDYIQSSGSQWINTRISENQVYGLRLVFEVTGVQAAWQSILGGTLDSGFIIGTRDTDASGMYVRLRGDEIINASGLLSGKNEVLIWGGNISINGAFKAAYTAGQLSGGSGTMFIGNNNGGNRPSQIKIYEVEFYDSSGQTIKKFTPYMGNSGECGLYDGVEEKFYSNAGSGNFTCGTRVGHKLLGPISLYNRWTQSSITEDVNQGDNISFRQLETTWPQHSGPLKPANSGDTKYDCDVKGTGNWYAPIGQYRIWDAGIPAASSGAVQQTELWVRLDKLFGAPNNFSIAENHITSTDFIEL